MARLPTISIQKVVKFIHNTHGKLFSVKFIKRSTGEERTMLCRTEVKKYLKGGERAYDPKEHGLIFVFDMTKKAYRSIPQEGIYEVRMGKRWYKVLQLKEQVDV